MVYDSQAGDESARQSCGPAGGTGGGGGQAPKATRVRHSDTLNRDMYYYAVQLENGDVLRLSKEEADNIWSVFRKYASADYQRSEFGMFLHVYAAVPLPDEQSWSARSRSLAGDIDNVDGIRDV